MTVQVALAAWGVGREDRCMNVLSLTERLAVANNVRLNLRFSCNKVTSNEPEETGELGVLPICWMRKRLDRP
jgi:hypothetical protein